MAQLATGQRPFLAHLTQGARNPTRVGKRAILYIVLGLLALVMLFPFYWQFVLATHTTNDITAGTPPFWFGRSFGANLATLLDYLPTFWRSILNSVIISVPPTLMTVFFSALGGFAFAKYRFPGKEKLFWVLLATMMIPGQLGLIPWYIQMSWMGWVNTFWPFIIPAMGSAFGVFWIRQYMSSAVPNEVMDAARIDGSSELGIFWRIAFPLAGPAIGALGITTFIGAWNGFLGPLIIMQTPNNYPLPVALATLRGVHGTDVGALLVGSSIATIPMLLAAVFGSRRIIDGLAAGALSGQ